MTLTLRVKRLENLRPIKPWFTIEINGEATTAAQYRTDHH
jgi:hypothetical protein